MSKVVPNSADVVVIGGGVMGASAAFHLAESGVDVVLVERGDLAGGSTSKAAGGVRANFSDELNIALGKRSLELFTDFPKRPGQQIDLHRSGYLFVLTSAEAVADFELAVVLQQQMGVRAEIVDPLRAAELSPYLDISGVLAAAWSPDDGHCSPESVVQGYAVGARNFGARVMTHTEVTDILVSGGEINAVVTQAGQISTHCVINCAGAWSPQIANLVGFELPVVPVRRQLVVTAPLRNALATAFTIDYGSTFYWHREGPGMLMGFSDQTTQPGFDCTADQEFLGKLAELAKVRAPALLDVGIKTGWAGLYEVTPDHNALLGESREVSRMLYATGFSGHGFLQGPAIGEILRDLYLGREPFLDISPLDVRRFASGALRPERNIV